MATRRKKRAKKGGHKGHVPLDILKKRFAKLGRIISQRGG